MNIDKERINLIITVVVIIILIQLYYNGSLDCILGPIEKMYSWVHYTTLRLLSQPIINLNNSEHYSPCPPSDCTRYRVRKDQLYVKNPFKWPWSGTDFPQYAVPYDEINKIASQKYAPRACWQNQNTINCENCRCGN